MQEKSDGELLRKYADEANEAAFREIVTRHADMVYASALRQVRSPELARDIAQTVFADLVRKAPSLGSTLAESASLVGWLYRGTRFAAHTQLRDNRRRQARERQAMENLTSETATEWERIGPVLDEAMADLSDEDREALLLRFFKNHDFRAIGVALGVSDDTAQKRVSRALERLRAEFNRRGVTTTAVALAAAVSTNAVSVGPVGLAATLSTAALTGTTLTTAATATATKAIAMTTLQKTIIAVALTAAVGVGIYEARQASRLRTQLEMLQQQQPPATEQNQQLTKDRDDALRQLAALRDENEHLNRNTAELAKLRGEVGRLRGEVAQFNQMQERNKLPTQDGYNERMPVMSAAMKMLVNAMNRFARENNGQYPTNLNQLEPGRLGWISLNAPGGDIGLDSFEVVNGGAVKDALSKTFLVRESTSHRNPDGRWERFYASSVGSVERIQSNDDNFDAWERLHMVLPVSSK